MTQKTIHYDDKTVDEAKTLFEQYKEIIVEFRRNNHITGRAGENHVLRRATELGMPRAAKELADMAKN